MTSLEHVAPSSLLHRRQFVLAPRRLTQLEGWRSTQLRANLVAHAHSDLPMAVAESGDVKLLLLGYIVDPDRENDTDAEVLRRLLGQTKDYRDLFSLTKSMGGRWVLVYDDTDATVLFTDAQGFRQVFYTTDSAERYCASQPSLLADVLGVKPDPQFAEEFLASRYCRGTAEYFFPGTLAGFSHVRILLPNHYYDLRHGSVHRFWPQSPLGSLSLDEGAEKSANMLRRLMRAISHRAPLQIGLTAGNDTRVVLAASRDIVGEAEWYTHRYWNRSFKHPDLVTSVRLAKQLHLKHRIIQCPATLEENVTDIYKRNVSFAHETAWGGIVMGCLLSFPPNVIRVTGGGGEIGRLFYGHAKNCTAEGLLDLHGMPHTPQALSTTREWFAEARDVESSCGINVLDLYYWEIRMAKWQAMSGAEYDIATDYFTPFNCRDLLGTMLAVNECYRDHRKPELFYQIIRYLWPEALVEPINPVTSRQVVWQSLLSLAHRVPGYWTLRRLLKGNRP